SQPGGSEFTRPISSILENAMKRLLNWFTGRTTSPVRKAHRRIPHFEALEDRYVPALIGGPDYSHVGQVIFNFDNNPDYVSVSTTYNSFFTSTTYVNVPDGVGGVNSYAVYFTPWIWHGDPTIVLNMGSSNDTVTVLGNANAVTINGQGGRDTVKIGNSFHSLQDIHNVVTVTNGPYYSDVTIDGSGDAAAKTATVSSNSVTGLAPAAINFVPYDLASLIIKGGNGNNTFTVADTPGNGFPVKTTLLCGSGNDTIQLQQTGGLLDINGGAGANTLVGPNADTLWQLTGSDQGTLSGSALGSSVKFAAVQNLTGGSANDTFTFSGGYLDGSLNGGGGSNTLDYSA